MAAAPGAAAAAAAPGITSVAFACASPSRVEGAWEDMLIRSCCAGGRGKGARVGCDCGVALWARRLHVAVRPHGSLASDIDSKECATLWNGTQRRAAGYLHAVKVKPAGG